jgi:cytochrome d ubiquinol oxidase subunit II
LNVERLPEAVAAVALAALVVYAVLAGADFGGGVWDLLARGPRAAAQRRAISEAMGPVWEANHVWLIFLIVLLFTCFPAAFAVLSVALFAPFHLVLVGIALRGAAFVFRAYGHEVANAPLSWGRVFGAASVITPLLLGMCLGAVSGGHIRVQGGVVLPGSGLAWLDPMSVACGALALALCAYLAAVYLTLETEGELRELYRRRALVTWLAAGAISLVTLLLTLVEAPRLWENLTTARASPVVGLGIALAPASGLAMWLRRYEVARVLGASQVALLLIGWALAQWPYIVYPDVTLAAAAAPAATLQFVLWTVPPGLALLVPSLWLLFTVFKGKNPAVEDESRSPRAEAQGVRDGR